MFNKKQSSSDWTLNKLGKRRMIGSCSALIKVLPDGSDIYTSHVTWNSYQAMIRILKKYTLGIRRTSSPDSPLVPGYSMSFSSYPGLLYSGDDFTVMSSGLVSMETTNGFSSKITFFRQNFGNLLTLTVLKMKHCSSTSDQPAKSSKESALWWPIVSHLTVNKRKLYQKYAKENILNKKGKEWTTLFGGYNSGTYNNQWMVINYKMFKPGKPLSSGLLWVLEQLPTLIEAKDMTDVLRNQSFWPSYNTPFFPSIFNLSGAPAMVEKYGDWFSYDNTPRALIFKRDQSTVTDMDSMIRLVLEQSRHPIALH